MHHVYICVFVYLYVHIYIYMYIYIYIYIYWPISLVDRAFVNDLGDRGLIPGQVIPKTQKMVLDTSLLHT